jgi:ferredoxin-NADP reductase
MIYTTHLAGRAEVAEGTIAFRFEKPAGFSFEPGQAIDLIHIDPPTTGTPGMVDAMRRTLTNVGIADDDIRSEEFHGY